MGLHGDCDKAFERERVESPGSRLRERRSQRQQGPVTTRFPSSSNVPSLAAPLHGCAKVVRALPDEAPGRDNAAIIWATLPTPNATHALLT
jgi:hypothetical protein